MTRLLAVAAFVLVVLIALLRLERNEDRGRSERGTVQVEVPGGRSSVRDSGRQEHPAGRDELSDVQDAGIWGQVVDPAGAPIEGALIEVSGVDAPLEPRFSAAIRTDALGNFRFVGAASAAKRAKFTVLHPQFRPVSGEERALGGAQRFVLDPGLRIRGRARFPDGSPASGVAIGAWDPIRTDEAGRFMLGGFKPGRVMIECEGASEEIEVEAGASDPVEFVLDASVVRVKAVDEYGGVLVGGTCRGKVGPHIFEGELGTRGIYTVATWPGYSGWVVANHEGYLPVRFDFDPRSDAPRLHELTAVFRKSPVHSIAIRVRAADGSLVKSRSATVQILDVDDVVLRRAQLALHDGAAILHGLPVGSARLQVYFGNTDVSVVREVSIAKGTENAEEFKLPPAGELLVIWRTDHTRVRLALERPDGSRLHTFFAARGGKNVWGTTGSVAFGTYRRSMDTPRM